MNLLAFYQKQCQKGIFFADEQQMAILLQLQPIFNELVKEYTKRQGVTGLLRRHHSIKGFYLWGGVGIGKTVLMDCFYHCLPFSAKKRYHFHPFMQQIQDALTRLQGKKNPLSIIAKEIAGTTLVLCFDEFFVSDITEAMLLGKLLDALYQEGVSFVATSNTAPDDLYLHGLQRNQFLPTIAALKKQTHVIHLSASKDYRLRQLRDDSVFFTPLDQTSQQKMENIFEWIRGKKVVSQQELILFGRAIPIIKATEDIIWFDFKAICTVPRSQKDYIALAKQYHTVFISNIPAITTLTKDGLQLWISLVDIFYDAHIRLVLSMAEPITVWQSNQSMPQLKRTLSRLSEMQSKAYFMKK